MLGFKERCRQYVRSVFSERDPSLTTHRKNFGIRGGGILSSIILILPPADGSYHVVASMLGGAVAAASTVEVDRNSLIES